MFVKFYWQFKKEQGDESSFMLRKRPANLLCRAEMDSFFFYTFITEEEGKVM